MPEKIERPFSRIAHPGRLYVGYADWQGYPTAESVAAAYASRHGQLPAEVVWTRPGMWQAGPVPEVAAVYGEIVTEPVPGAPGASQAEIETTPRAVGQLGLF